MVREELINDAENKRKAWRRQSDALKAPAYSLTLTARRQGLQTFNLGKPKVEGKPERIFTAIDVEELIPELRRQNVLGYDIYIMPLDSQHHYLVLDDMSETSLTALHGEGYQPCLVQSGNAGNYQSIIKTTRVHRIDEQSLANSLVQKLNQEFGDKKCSEATHFFRMAGFGNKKEGCGNFVTRIIEGEHRLCQRTFDFFLRMRGEADLIAANAVAERDKAHRISKIEAVADYSSARISGVDVTSAGYAYTVEAARVLSGMRSNGLPEDWSKIDYQVSIAMLKSGWSEGDVEAVLLDSSPAMHEGHSQPSSYARCTVSYAAAEPEVQIAIKERHFSDIAMGPR